MHIIADGKAVMGNCPFRVDFSVISSHFFTEILRYGPLCSAQRNQGTNQVWIICERSVAFSQMSRTCNFKTPFFILSSELATPKFQRVIAHIRGVWCCRTRHIDLITRKFNLIWANASYRYSRTDIGSNYHRFIRKHLRNLGFSF